MFHPLNAYDADDGTVVVDLCRYDRMMETDRTGPFGDCTPTFDRWVIDPVAKRVLETRLDDRPQEFPRHHPGVGTPTSSLRLHLGGVRRRARTCTARSSSIDVEAGTTEAHEFGGARGGAEPIVVPKADGIAEDDAWILTVVYDPATDASELCILDAQDITGPEVARIRSPAACAVRLPRQLGARQLGRTTGLTIASGV